MADSPHIVEVNQDNFNQVVIEGSMRVPVLVDFWADWCNPCRMLMPVLAKLAGEYNGQFVLAKINSDQNQEIAAQYGVRSLPTVKLFKGGEPVDEFMGALPESSIKEFLDKHIDRESDKLLQLAADARSSGDLEKAQSLLEKAKTLDPGRAIILTELAQVLAEMNDTKTAKAVLDSLPPDEQARQPAAGLLARLDFLTEATDYPPTEELAKKLEDDRDDLKVRYQIAIRYITDNRLTEGMDELLEIMRKDRNYKDDIARNTLLKVFDLLGDEPLTNNYRRKMANLLY